MRIEPEWTWARVNEKMLASFVSPQLASRASGEVSPEEYRGLYSYDSDELVEAVTTRRYDPDESLPSGGRFTDFDLLRDRPKLARRIYNRLRAREVAYQLEPIGVNDDEQAIRSPSQVLGSVTRPGEGTCLDLSLLYAGICLHRNLLPLVVLFEDHAIAMVAVNHDRRDVDGYRPEDAVLSNGLATDGERVRALVKEKKSHLAIECTGFAVSHTLEDRNKAGTLSFDRAVKDGARALEERKFSFAIDPLWLHRRGVAPVEQMLDLSNPNERAMIGAKRTDALVRAVAAYSPSLLEKGTPNELAELKAALKEVADTYNIMRKVTTRWISAALDDAKLDSSLLTDLITGNLKADIHKGRGSCGEILRIYDASLASFIDRAISDKDERARIHEAFGVLAEADEDMFVIFEQAGRYLQDEAQAIRDLRRSGTPEDLATAQRRFSSNYAEVARFQQAINESRNAMVTLGRTLSIDVG